MSSSADRRCRLYPQAGPHRGPPANNGDKRTASCELPPALPASYPGRTTAPFLPLHCPPRAGFSKFAYIKTHRSGRRGGLSFSQTLIGAAGFNVPTRETSGRGKPPGRPFRMASRSIETLRPARRLLRFGARRLTRNDIPFGVPTCPFAARGTSYPLAA